MENVIFCPVLVTDLADRTRCYLVVTRIYPRNSKRFAIFMLDFLLNFVSKSVDSLPKFNLLQGSDHLRKKMKIKNYSRCKLYAVVNI